MRPPTTLADPPPPAPSLDDETLAAVAQLWKRSGRELRARFGGSSMQPSLAPESEVVLRCGAPASVGDVVAYIVQGRVVLHRVEAISARDGSLLTRGDARLLPDLPVRDPDAILGVLRAVEGGGGLEPVPPAPRSALRSVALWPFRVTLAASPAAAAALLAGLVWSRRLLLSAGGALRGRFRGPVA